MRHNILTVFLFVFGLAGCAHQNFGENLQTLEGQNIDYVIRYLGLPDDRFALDDKDIYIWGHDEAQIIERPISTYGGYNSRGGAFGGVGLVFGGGARDSYRYGCTIKALTNKDKIVEKLEYKNSAGGCSKYSKALKTLNAENQNTLQ